MSEHINKYHKGAEWRRWDLHIHTPGTKKSDRFSGTTLDEKWQNFIQTVNSSSEPISVVGIRSLEYGVLTAVFFIFLPFLVL